MAIKDLYRRQQVQWPFTESQVEGVNQEVDAIYRGLREIGAVAGEAAKLIGLIPAANLPALTGDVTKPAGSAATTLTTTGVAAGTYGSAINVPQITVDAKGRISAASNIAISAGIRSILTNGDVNSPELIFDSFGDVITIT